MTAGFEPLDILQAIAMLLAQLREGRRDPATPRIDAMLDRLADGYTRLCWNCQVELSTAISGLCPLCEAELRR